jgi:hypothetical protein
MRILMLVASTTYHIAIDKITSPSKGLPKSHVASFQNEAFDPSTFVASFFCSLCHGLYLLIFVQ